MDSLDFSNFDEQLSAFEDQSSLESSAIDRFLIGDAASMIQVTSLEPSTRYMEEDFVANLDPAFLLPFDASLNALTPLPSLEVTDTSMFDPSTGVEWQPMENNETSIDPTDVNPFDLYLDPFAVQTPLFSSDVIFPAQSIQSATNTAASLPETTSHSFLEPPDQRPAGGRSKKRPSNTLRHPATRPTSGWHKTKQPRVICSDCPCALCKGGPVSLASLRQKVHKAPKNGRVAKNPNGHNKPPKRGRGTKSAAKKVVPRYESEGSDSSLSSVPDLEDLSEPDYRPLPTARTRRAAALRKKRGFRKVVAQTDVPKELDIDMEGWW
ncbi:MAG: hypothetical protein Q9196_006324 [Gyalolechia fulgens]